MENKEKATDVLSFKGVATITLTGPSGEIKHQEVVENLITAAGIAHMAARVSGVSVPAAMAWMAIGVGAVAPAVANTGLGAEVARVAVAPAVFLSTTTLTNDTINYQATFPAAIPAGTHSISEAGVFGSAIALAEPMLNRLTFAPITKGPGDALTIAWRVRIG